MCKRVDEALAMTDALAKESEFLRQNKQEVIEKEGRALYEDVQDQIAQEIKQIFDGLKDIE